MVYGYVKQSCGHIVVYSEVGYGTAFNLYFPRTAAKGQAAETAGIATAIPHGTESILLVEDNLGIRSVAERQLISLGYRVQLAENGPEALYLLDTDAAIDLLFTDIVMPAGMTGFELAEEARKRQPALKVLFTSGFHAAAMKGNVATQSMLAKPYRLQEMAQKVRAVLDRAA